MEDLVKAFFQRDLTPSEEDQLGKIIESSPEEALRYHEAAVAYYSRLDLPDPSGPSGGSGFGLKRLFWGGMVLAALWGGWYWINRIRSPEIASQAPTAQSAPIKPQAAPVRPKIAPGVKVAKSTSPKQAPLVSGVPQRLEAGRLYDGITAIVQQGARGLVTVRVLDTAGNEVRLLYAGVLDPGEWVFLWDGHDEQGQPVATGTYVVQSQSGKAVINKNVVVGVGK